MGYQSYEQSYGYGQAYGWTYAYPPVGYPCMSYAPPPPPPPCVYYCTPAETIVLRDGNFSGGVGPAFVSGGGGGTTPAKGVNQLGAMVGMRTAF